MKEKFCEYSYKNRMNKIGKVVNFLNANSVLDIGCRNKNLKNCISKKVRYLGVDVVKEADVKMNLNKIEKLPFKSKEFDVVVLSQILEHLFYPQKILREAIRVAKKYLIIGLPNDFAYMLRINYLLGKSYISFSEFEHKGVMSISNMRSFLQIKDNKLKILKKWYNAPLIKIGEKYLFVGLSEILARIYPKLFANEVFFLFEK